MKLLKSATAFGLLAALLFPANAETVFVKYRGIVDLAPFQCQDVERSSLVTRICYDRREQYLIIGLLGTYYHYCEIDSETISGLKTVQSMGRFYNSYIKGNFDCRIHKMPTYNK